jgi:uncharacterized membrane-anchored protein
MEVSVRFLSYLIVFFCLTVLVGVDAIADDDRTGHQHRIITASDMNQMSPDELRTHIQECHDMCRIGKAERLERARQMQADASTIKAHGYSIC